MKRLFSVLGLILISTNCYAGTISISPFISGNDVTIARLETQRTTISNVINGNIEGGTNIKAGSLVTADFSNAVSPVTRWDEAFNDFTYEGMLPATDSDLTSDISAGTSYVSGYRVVIGTTSHTYTASKDTYVYVNKGGFYNFDPVANGAAAPSNYTSANGNLLLAVVVTSGSAITSVTDSRTTGISLSSGANLVPTDYRVNMTVVQASTTTMTVNAGYLEINGSKISKTSSTTLTLGTAADWAGGGSLRAVSTYGYVGVDASGNIKMHTTAPTHSNYALSVTAGTKRYAAWSGTTYRVIGWFYMNATGAGELSSYEVSNIPDMGVKNIVTRNGSTDDTINDTSYGSDLTECQIHFYTSGGMTTISHNSWLDNPGAAIDDGNFILDDGGDIANSERGFYQTATLQANHMSIEYSSPYAQGTKTFDVQAKVNTSTVVVKEKTTTIRED